MKGISVIIPTLNRTDFLLNTLQDIIVQDFDGDFEVLIIDQSNRVDQRVINFCDTNGVVTHHHITLFKGLPEARNYGVAKSKYDIVLFLDDDIECKQNLLSEHFVAHQQINIGVVAGGITEKFKENRNTEIGFFNWKTAHPTRGFHQQAKKEVDHAGGGNFSVKKDVYDEVGGVDENLTVGAALYEETDFCLRVKSKGYMVYFNYEAHMYHLAAATGGCRVEEIDKYIYSLSRNKSILIYRYLPYVNRITAKAHLIKLIISYAIAYKSLSVLGAYIKGNKEGKNVAQQQVKRTYV